MINMNISIDGFWTTKAGDYDPQTSIRTPVSDNRFFYRINHDSTVRQKVIVEILVDSRQVGLVHDWLSKDGKETFFFDVPSERQSFRFLPLVHLILPAVKNNDPPNDCKPQSFCFRVTSCGIAGGKLIPDLVHELGIDTDPGILDGYRHSFPLLHCGYGDGTFEIIVFHCVVDQVAEELAGMTL